MQVNEVVPFLAVEDMKASVAFYVDGLGFQFKGKWEVDGELCWCRLQLGGAGVMLQQFPAEGHDARRFNGNRGEGVELCFFLDDALEFHRFCVSRGIGASEPVVSNRLWATHLIDPDGYRLLFESPTDTPEDTRLSEVS